MVICGKLPLTVLGYVSYWVTTQLPSKLPLNFLLTRGRITEGRSILKDAGLTGIPSPLWRNKHIPATKCSTGADKLHQRNLGFVSRIEKALVKPNGLFGGARLKHTLNAFFTVLRLHGFAGLCKSSKLLETSSLQAKERQVCLYVAM